jgi:hypothetical protein
MAWTTPGTATAGEVLTAAFWNANVRDNSLELAPFFSAWTSYTPSWTNLTVGNAVVTAKYFQIGKTVFYFGSIVWGSTTSATSSTTLVSLPVTAISSNFDLANGSLFIGDSGTRGYVGVCAPQTTTTMIFHHSESGNFGDVNATAPFTFGVADFLKWSLIYQAA